LRLVYERSFITCAHAGHRVIENVPISNLQDFIIEFTVLSGDGMPGIDFRGTTSSWGYVLLVGRFISSDGSSNDLRLWKLFGTTNILDVNSGRAPASPPCTVTVEVNGATADVWIDGNYAGTFSIWCRHRPGTCMHELLRRVDGHCGLLQHTHLGTLTGG
jgi:hypothetical protein